MDYRKLVGRKLRETRKNKGYSLKDVEAKSKSHFKAPTLGAYERGQRNISVSHIWELAQFYDVSPDELVRVEEEPVARRKQKSLRITPEFSETDENLLRTYLKFVDTKRKEFDWKVHSLRRDDISSLAHILNITPDVIDEKLDQIMKQ